MFEHDEELASCLPQTSVETIGDGRFPVENLPRKHQIKMAKSFLYNYAVCRTSGQSPEQTLATLAEEWPFVFAPRDEANLASLAEKMLQQKSDTPFQVVSAFA